MSSKTISRLAWAFCILVILFAVVETFWEFQNQAGDRDILSVIDPFVTIATFAAFAIVGTLIVSHQPRNTIGWLMMIEAALVFVFPIYFYFDNLFQPPVQPTLLTYIGLWSYMWLWLFYIFPLLFTPLFFPTGRLLSRRWRWVVAMGLGFCLYFIVVATFGPEFKSSQGDSWSVANPIGIINWDIGTVWVALLLSTAGLSVGSLFVRYRRGTRIEKEQIKWLLYAAAIFSVAFSLTIFFNNTGGILEVLTVWIRGLVAILVPAAIGVAILRYRLYDIDVIIRKTLVYAILTGALTLVYFGMVVLLQAFVDRTTNEQSPLIIVISTLVIAALFTPLRRRIQAVIDRRFFRKKYDAQQVLAQFAQTARDETDMERLTAELHQVIHETLQPEGISMWLKTVNKQA